MDLELEIEGVKVRAKVDTSFDGEMIVTKEVFDAIPYDPSEGPRICMWPQWSAIPLTYSWLRRDL